MSIKTTTTTHDLALRVFTDANGTEWDLLLWKQSWWFIDTKVGIANWCEGQEILWN